MTKQEILDGLEGLKDLVNNNGKAQLDALKASVMGLEEPVVVVPEPVIEKKPEPKHEVHAKVETKAKPHVSKRK